MEKPVQPDRPASTQKTPKGYEIPVPSRDSIFAAFRKIAKKPTK
jgi:hypothetical protein